MAWVSFNVILGVRKYEIDFESIGAIYIIFKDSVFDKFAKNFE